MSAKGGGLELLAIDASGGILDWAMFSTGLFRTGEMDVLSVRHLVSQVLAKTAKGDKIKCLWIHGHGAPGYQGIGSSTNVDMTGAKGLIVNTAGELHGDAGKELPRLAGKFVPNGSICLGGCWTGNGEAGKKLLMTVSKALGGTVWAMAGDSVQTPILPGFEGNVVCCNAGSCWIQKAGKWTKG